MPSIIENIKTLQEERAAAWNKAKPLVDKITADNRGFTAEERSEFDKINADLDAYKDRIDTLQRARQQEDEVSAFRKQMEGTDDIVGTLESELRAVFGKNPSQREMQIGIKGKEFKRALSVGTLAAGGNTVPTTFWNEFILPLRNFSSVLQAGARVVTTSSGEPINIPRVLTPGAAAQVSEGTTIGGTDPTFDNFPWSVYKYGELILVSRELVQDSAIDIESLIGDLLGQNIGILLGAGLATGSGTGAPQGLLTATTVGATGATIGNGGAATFDDLINLYYSVIPAYRTNGKWITSDVALAGLRKLKDSYGQYIWSPSVQLDTPDTILGKPVYSDPNFTSPAVNGKSLVFGDISRYWVRVVNSLEIARSDQFAFGTDQIAFRGILRAGGVLTDVSAVKAFKGAAS